MLLAACASPLSTQGVKPASTPAPQAQAQATPFAATPQSPITPTEPDSTDSGPSAKSESGDEKSSRPPERAQPHIALILPVASKTFGKVADAVKQGFLAGALADGKNAPPFRIYAADDDVGALAAQYRKAATEGAMAIVGGVTRDGAGIMAREASYLPTLALNSPAAANEGDLPDRFFYISLNIDWEARFAARTASNEGLRRVAILASAAPLAKRVQQSFEKEWIRLGGEIAVRISANGDPSEGPRVQSAMEKANADVVFLAAEMKVARFARPYLPVGIPVFATSMTIDPRADAIDNLDLESVRFMEMPWFVQPDHPAVMAYAKPVDALPIEYERLYALGIDAWRLAQTIITQDRVKSLPPLDGVTGRLMLEGHQFVRQLSAGEMRDGRPALFKPAE